MGGSETFEILKGGEFLEDLNNSFDSCSHFNYTCILLLTVAE